MSEISRWTKNNRNCRDGIGDISVTTGHTEMVHLSKFAAFYETVNETNFMFEILWQIIAKFIFKPKDTTVGTPLSSDN